MPEIPSGNNGQRGHTFNKERKADACDNMPEI
jgi:hypothetical protein